MLRLATSTDLPQLRTMFKDITAKLNAACGEIWNDFYPTELFPDDVENRCLYVLEREGRLLSAMALCEHIEAEAEEAVAWTVAEKPLYFCRFGVHAGHQREGLGRVMVEEAVRLARAGGYDALRLYVVDRNTPAIAFYESYGFVRTPGYFEEYIRDDLTLRQYGYEYEL